jgi:uncharacterized protein (UPF0248 family)
MTRKKGRLEEIFSKAKYADDPRRYSVSYRDFQSIVQVPLLDFLELSENFELIPANRIVVVSKEGEVIYRKFSEIKSI